MNTPVVFNIQKYSTHDGDGIRTTLFFKGCPLNCMWCHNPESQRFMPELIYRHDKCTVCGRCIPVCPEHCNTFSNGQILFDRAACTKCGACTDACLAGAREICGKTYDIDELVKKAVRDKPFYEQSGGGVTLSGGEVMCLDMDYIAELCRKIKEQGVSVYIDTSGYCSYENFKKVLPYTDIFLYDIKCMDPEKHKKYIGVDNALILENLKKLSDDGAGIYVRIPTIGKVNADDESMQAVIDYLKEKGIHPVAVNLLPYHDFHRGKYANLDRPYEEELMSVPTDEEMEHFRQMFIQAGYENTTIGG